MNIFEQASRQALRFESNRGDLTTEQLWTLPLTSRNGFDLDSVARAIAHGLKDLGEESFVETRSNPAKATFELKLEVVKFIIADKQAAAAEATLRAEKAQQKEKLLNILGKKQDAELEGLSAEEIKARIEAL